MLVWVGDLKDFNLLGVCIGLDMSQTALSRILTERDIWEIPGILQHMI